jgi:hypothetical protein
MKAESFVYWLQGMFELCEPKALDERQTALIRQHLALVFRHEIDPAMGDEKHQAELDKIHGQGMSVNPHGVVMRC